MTESNDLSALSYFDGHLFLNFDKGDHNRVVVYPIHDGLPGDAMGDYTLAVHDSEGISVRAAGHDRMEVFFMSDSLRSIFAYEFSFHDGFMPHPLCQHRLRGSVLASGVETQLHRRRAQHHRQQHMRRRSSATLKLGWPPATPAMSY